MLKVIVPMAGAGSRFVAAGYHDPKPFIDVNGKTMIERVIVTAPTCTNMSFIFIMQRSHFTLEREDMLRTACFNHGPLSAGCNGCEILFVDGLTAGAACTVLLAEHLVHRDDKLLI